MKTPPRNILVITLIAVALHTLLFIIVQPGRLVAGRRAGKAPVTWYMTQGAGAANLSGRAVRVINSPVIFSLPSSMGFSRELQGNDVSTKLNTFSRPGQTERFLAPDSVAVRSSGRFNAASFMVTPTTATEPGLPLDIYDVEVKRPSSRRVTISPELKNRLVGGVVLPAELNKPVSVSWEAKASVRISEDGLVEHVFFDEPLGEELNRPLQRLIYSLRFKSGDSVDGRIEIYSPEPSPINEDTP